MKLLLNSLALTILTLTWGLNATMAQCPGCTIDPSCGVGLNPIEPALCPEVLPNGVQGQPYDQNLTFYMPRNFTDAGSGADVTLNSIIVTQITGMPQGLAYECDQPNCSYTVTNDPNSERGCVKICGIPTVPGNYNVVVSMVANVTTPIGTINQPTGFTLPLTIDPAPGGNCCFSFDPPSACGSLEVDYDALLSFEPLQPTTYDWDFDNGEISTDMNPALQSYANPGDYYPELTTTVYNYVVSEVTFIAAGSNWCGDVEELSIGGGCQGDPDIYFNFSNGNQASQSSTVDNNLTATWTGLSYVLENNVFTLSFSDEDTGSPFGSPDDDLGSYSHNTTATGTFNFSTFFLGNQEGFGTVTIITEVDQIIVTEDTVSVFPVPATPQISFSPSQNVCAGDSVLVSGPVGPYQYQWLQAGSFISDSVAVWTSETDYYSLLIIDTNFYCQALSDSDLVQILPYPVAPLITYNSSTGNLEITNNSENYDVAWYNDGVLIQGENGDTLAGQTSSGPFTVEFSNEANCTNSSATEFWLCVPDAVAPLSNDTICCGETVTFDASGFTVNPFSTVAWAITPESDGPITDQQDATDAEADGYVLTQFGSSIDFTRNCSTWADSVMAGNFYVTPFAIEDPNITPFTYDTLQGCAPNGELCPVLVGEDSTWSIQPMIFTFPDGSTLNVNDALAFGLPLTQPLIDFAGGLPCLSLSSLYAGDPNGVWSVSITNVGPVGIDLSVPDFIVTNWADTCNLITVDESYLIPGVEITAAPGQTVVATFNIPPLPGGFPTVDPDCSAFGDPILITFADCYPELTNNLSVTGTAVNSTIVQGNGFIDVTITGGTPPYTSVWDDGPTSVSRFNLTPGTYTTTVTDAAGLQASETWVITGPYLGIESDLDLHGFSLEQSIPNPTNGSTTIGFNSLEKTDYDFVVREISGREVARLHISAKSGENRIIFEASRLSAGLYTYSLTNGVSVLTQRMVISK